MSITKFGWFALSIFILLPIATWFILPDMVWQETGESAQGLKFAFCALPLMGIYFVLKWEREDKDN